MRTSKFLLSVLADQSVYIECCFVVTHLVPDGINFANSISKISKHVYLIPKSSSSRIGCYELEKNITLLKINKKEFLSCDAKLTMLLEKITLNRKFFIFDMGGYFSKIVCKELISTSNLICLVEDTENGHQRYLKEIAYSGPKKFPIYSVARSPLKTPEDYLVGQAIVFSAERYLRHQNELLACKKALVIGYGKIGSSVAHALRSRGVIVYVCDIDYLKLVIAQAHSFKTIEKNQIINQVDLIFSATGNRALNFKDLEKIKKMCYVFSATSSDDEFCGQLNSLLSTRAKSTSDHDIKINNIVFPNFGNPINFRDGAVVGRFIQLVQAEMIHVSRYHKKLSAYEGIYELSNTRRRYIAKKWIEQLHG